ncbi:MAG: aminoalkylphosphonate N-acetyltransferase [Zoogloeaceae bacterium]|jgi:PhnO protein|nr:aminoalkylphosphonate N-acetyltransferase [Zoogloeaceae bacterium]
MTLQFRPATPPDFDAIHALIKILGHDLDFARTRQIYLDNLDNPNVRYRVAVAEAARVVGFISLSLQKHLHHAAIIGEIQELIIEPACRGQNIGQTLLRQMEQIALQAGAVTVELSTGTHRKDAHRFYEREGFLRSHYRFVKELQAARQDTCQQI